MLSLVRLSDMTILALVIAQAIVGLAAAAWRASRRERKRPYVDLTDLTALSRSVSGPLRPR
jgi:hypothetical protein